MTPLTLDSHDQPAARDQPVACDQPVARDPSWHAQPGISPEPAHCATRDLLPHQSPNTSQDLFPTSQPKHPQSLPKAGQKAAGGGGGGVRLRACARPPLAESHRWHYSRRGTSVPIPAVEFPPVETLRLINSLISLPNPLADPLNTLVTTTRRAVFEKKTLSGQIPFSARSGVIISCFPRPWGQASIWVNARGPRRPWTGP